ncbi:MAG: prenyltransferase/squalene oxidase repeat-containing protein [Isosphaeraceae bacterium]|nr:prenyltransferase/squalene oxidase repeat-containing protein [Isosphaeraceae bacterium]
MLMRMLILVLGVSVQLASAADEIEEIPAASADEPLASAPSLQRAEVFLDRASLDWTRRRQCGTCHTNYVYMLARPTKTDSRSEAEREIRRFFENRVEHWGDAEPSAKPKWDAEVIATAVTLALNDAAIGSQPSSSSRRAFDRVWRLQREDGGFDWLKCGWPPYEHDDYFGAVFAALGVSAAPSEYSRSAEAARGVERLKGYLRANSPPDLHHRLFLYWASLGLDGLMTESDRADLLERIRGLQRADGGWSLASLGSWSRRDGSANPADAPSDGYATGLVVYLLRRSGVERNDPTVARGRRWLERNQRESGRWYTRSLNNDKAHYIANAGTAYALMALRACADGGE